MENRDEPINPCLIKGRQGFADLPTIPNREVYGLTKREYFAGLAMQALLSKDKVMYEELPTTSSILIAKLAVKSADTLLRELKNK